MIYHTLILWLRDSNLKLDLHLATTGILGRGNNSTYGETESQLYETKPTNAPLNWLMVSTHLKNITVVKLEIFPK